MTLLLEIVAMPTRLAIRSFCGYLTVFVCLSLGCWRLDVDLILVPEFTYLQALCSINEQNSLQAPVSNLNRAHLPADNYKQS